MSLMMLSVLIGGSSLAPSSSEVSFSESLQTCFSPPALWRELGLSMVDSHDSLLWPNDRSRAEGEGLFDGSEIRVTYGRGFFAPTYDYELSEVEPHQSFTYSATGNHPLQGGATLSLVPEKMGSRLVWDGSYEIPRGKEHLRKRLKTFLPRFFSSLRRNITEICN